VWRARARSERAFVATLATNLVGLSISLGAAEALIRALEVHTEAGPAVAGLLLQPRSWSLVRKRHESILAQAEAVSFLVADPEMGWVVGKSRQGQNGLYRSSAEGVRSGEVGVSYRNATPRWRVALVGDSYTFGLDVAFEDSWGHHLERMLGADALVLNLGVDGYGIDQAYLRYLRDARPWNPDVAILGIFPHDFDRTMSVYPFVSFPTWGIPFAKPRFVVEGGVLRNVNPAPLSGEQIAARESIFELPWLELDGGFHPDEWRWRRIHASHLIRFLISSFPRARAVPPQLSEDSKREVNGALLAAFLREAEASGARPLLVYLPSRVELPGDPAYEPMFTRTRELLEERGLDYVDLTPVLGKIAPGERFVEGHGHYTPHANRLVAETLAPVVRGMFPQASAPSPR
jgi:hypothetical protein